MPEKPEQVLTSGISILQERALDLIASRSDGVFQSDLRRLLSIDSSKCSKVVTRMQNSGLIYREKVPASSTYLIKLVHPSATPAIDENDAAAEVQKSNIDSNIDSHIDSPVNSHKESNIDSILDGKINSQVVSYFDCNIDGCIDSDIGSQIDGYFDSQRYTDSHSHIDSFLTEIYLLYLVRGISS